MNKELVVNRSLYHLLEVLLDLDNYKFDKDIIAILNQLKSEVDKKIYSSFSFLDSSSYVLDSDLILILKPLGKK